MKDVKDFISWKVTDISIRPYDEMWSMNPSIHFDGSLWRCVLRCTDYAMPNGHTIRSKKAGPGHQTKNAMVIFDPQTWKPIQIYKMHERDDHPRVSCANIGYEDMRIFKTDRGGIQGIAASLHLKRDGRPAAGGAQHQAPEQVLLSFDAEYNIVAARPIRSDRWSGPQKNWVPFDHCMEPRFLYSIGHGTMFDDRGALHDGAAVVRPSISARPILANLPIIPRPSPEASQLEEREREQREQREREQREQREQEEREQRKQDRERSRSKHPDLRTMIRGSDVSMVRGRRVAVDALSSRRPSLRHVGSRGGNGSGNGSRGGNESTRILGTGRTLLPRYEGLRGGTQLVRVGEDAWLGIGHEMKFVNHLKYYWHVFYLVNSAGKLIAASPPCKLASNGIEFAAGMAIDEDRVVVSFGVDDMECRIAETSLSAVLGMLQPVEQ